MKLKLSFNYPLLVTLTATLLTGCGPSTDQTAPSPTALVELRAGVIPVAECAILNNAEVFRRHGIILKLTKAASGTQISDGVIGGGLDFGYSNLATPIIAESRGIALRIIGPITIEDDNRSRHGLVVRKDGVITKPQDLNGKIIALNAFKNIDHLMLLRWLKENGLDPADVRLQTTPFPNMMQALENHSVDAVAVVEPFITMALVRTNTFSVLGHYYSSKSGKPTAVSGFVAREDWLRKNKPLASQLVAALVEAAEDAETNAPAFRSNVVSMTGTDAAIVEKMPLVWYQATGYQESVADLAKVAVEQKFIEREIDANKLLFTPQPH